MSISSAKESLTLLAAIEYFGCIYVDAENFDHDRDRVADRHYARARMAESTSVQFQTRDRSRLEEIPDRISAGHMSSHLSGH
jgi:hypothetical protein